MDDKIQADKIRRTSAYRKLSAATIIALTIAGFWFLSSLILPIVFGFLLAYICVPIISYLRRKGIPQIAGVFILLVTFSIALFFTIVFVRAQLPDAQEQMEIRLITLNQINDKYQSFMGISSSLNREGNFIYKIFGSETDFFMDSVNEYLILNEEEIAFFESNLLFNNYSQEEISRLRSLVFANNSTRSYVTGSILIDIKSDTIDGFYTTPGFLSISVFMGLFSTWVVLPLVFFFFLLDDGKFKREIFKIIPNVYFEMSLTSFKNVDESIGDYLRGTAMETIAVFIAFLILLPIIGFGFTPTLLIALLASILNIIPFIGPIGGIILCVFYALLLTDVNSILPFINTENIYIFAALVGILVQVLDNTYFKPIILGNAVNLHPLVVILSIIAGGLVFGFWGVLLAIPVVMIFKVVVSTVHAQLKLYQLINN